jgi:hypothetical protein
MLRCKENALTSFGKEMPFVPGKSPLDTFNTHIYLLSKGCLFVLSATIEISQTVFLKGNWGALLMLL